MLNYGAGDLPIAKIPLVPPLKKGEIKRGICSGTCLPSRKKATHRQAGSEALQREL
jgi:hypothetical protein